MVVALRCECGYVAEGDDDTGLVTVVQAHASKAHGVELSRETIVRLARESAAVAAAGSVNTTTSTGG